jgi:hypothetical protein
VSIISLKAQHLTVEWVNQMKGSPVKSISTDSEGNIYATGVLSSLTDFDSGPGVYNLIPGPNLMSIFISKMNSAGEFIWAKKIEGELLYIKDIEVDEESNVYIYGTFSFSVDFDPGPGTCILDFQGGTDAYIVKLNAEGDFVWAKTFGGLNNQWASCIHLDEEQNILLSGSFKGDADFDPGSGTEIFNTYSPVLDDYTFDIYISKLNPSGQLIWAKQFRTYSYGESSAMTTDHANNIFLTGYYVKMLDADPGNNTVNLEGSNLINKNAFLLKLDANGDFMFSKNYTSTFNIYATSIAQDENDNLYLAGTFEGEADLDPGPNVLTAISNVSSNGFICKLDAAGNTVWGKGFGGPNTEKLLFLGLDSQGNPISSGYFSLYSEFDTGSDPFILNSNGNIDVFITKLDTNGQFIWAKNIGGTNYEELTDMRFDNSGNIFLSGTMVSNTDLDPEYSGVPWYNISEGKQYIEKLSLTTLGFGDLSIDSDWTIYPNPTNGKCNIHSENSSIQHLRLFSFEGQLVQAIPSINQKTFSFELQQKPGFYWLEITDQSGHCSTVKVVKQ